MGIRIERADRLHLVLTSLFALGLYPACWLTGLHLSLGGGGFLWLLIIGAHCLPVAAVMATLDAVPQTVSLLRRDWLRVLLFGVAGFSLGVMFGATGWLLAFDAFLVFEYCVLRPGKLLPTLGNLAAPGLYFVLGFSLVVLWNDVIVSVRWFATADPLLTAIDRVITLGHSVQGISAWAASYPRLILCADYVYFLMFRVMGAGIILLALDRGMTRAMRAVGTILLAYFVALAIFALIPGAGPFWGDTAHYQAFSGTLDTIIFQKKLIEQPMALWHHAGTSAIQGGYYIAFPSMHIVQPLIVTQFLRYRRHLTVALGVYLAALAVAIILLDWHYVCDVMGGIGLAIAALWLCGEAPWKKPPAQG